MEMAVALTLEPVQISSLARVPRAPELRHYTEFVRAVTEEICLGWEKLGLDVRERLRHLAMDIASGRPRFGLGTWLRLTWLMVRASRKEVNEYLVASARLVTALLDAVEREKESADRAFEQMKNDPKIRASVEQGYRDFEEGRVHTSAEVEALLERD